MIWNFLNGVSLMMFLFDWKSSTEKLTMFYLNISFAKNDGTAGEKVV